MGRIITLFLLIITVSCGLLAQDGKPISKERKKYLKNFGRFTPESYIITKEERRAYRRLQTDDERETFIKRFWEIRDPISATPQNEMRVEFEKRVDWANVYLKSDSRAGWKSDMGMIHILLGPPDEKRDVDGPDPRFPGELWIYRNRPGSEGGEEERFYFYYDLKRAGWYMDQGGRFDNAKFEIRSPSSAARKKYGLGTEDNAYMPADVLAPTVNPAQMETGINLDTSYGTGNLIQAQIGVTPNLVERRLRALIQAVGEERRSHFQAFGKTPGWNMQVGVVPDGQGGINLTCVGRMRFKEAPGPLTAHVEMRPTQGGEPLKSAPQELQLCSIGKDHFFQITTPLPAEGNHEFLLDVKNRHGETQGIGATIIGSVAPEILLEPGVLPPMLFQTAYQGCFEVEKQQFSPVLGGLVGYTNNVALQVFTRGEAEKTYRLRVFPEWMSKGEWKLLPGTVMELEVTPFAPELLVLSDVLQDRIGEWRVRFELSEEGENDAIATYTQHFVIQ